MQPSARAWVSIDTVMVFPIQIQAGLAVPHCLLPDSRHSGQPLSQMPRTSLRAPRPGLRLMSTDAEAHGLLVHLDIFFAKILSSSYTSRVPGSPGGLGQAGGLHQQDMAKQLFHQRSRTPGSHALPVHEPRDEVQVHLDISLESLRLPACCKTCAICAVLLHKPADPNALI